MKSSPAYPAAALGALLVGIILLHLPLLGLPYFWDEAGYYVAAARDLLLTGSLIPHTTVSNAHPPLVLAWLALAWKVFGYRPVVTRLAMLAVAAISLLGFFRLAERAANTEVALASTLCTALYPVFFAQSSLAQVDLAAAGLTFWGLYAYLDDRPGAAAFWFSLAVLAKETAILAPLALFGWNLLVWVFPRHLAPGSLHGGRDGLGPAVGKSSPANRIARRSLALVLPGIPLAAWYAYHYVHTGYVFGNPEFFRYNVAATLNPLRFLLALLFRLWQTFGYLHLWLLTGLMLLAMRRPPVRDAGGERLPIALPVQIIFLAVVSAYVLFLALIGGAVLARYLLPVVPLVILEAVATLRRRLLHWRAAVALVAAGFVLAWFWNPPYGFSPEDNLAYRDFVVLHQHAEHFLEARYPSARVLTAWPASDELTSPWLGYVRRPMAVVRLENFSLEQILSAADFRQNFEIALVFSTKYEPAHPWLERSDTWFQLKRRFFGYERDLPAAAAAQILGGQVVFSEEKQGQRIAVIALEKSETFDAQRLPPRPAMGAVFPDVRP
jgi:hypothetical protein